MNHFALSKLGIIAGTSMFIAAQVTGAGAQALNNVKSRDRVVCGVAPASVGYSAENNQGQRVGFDIDTCRAIGAAVLGDPTKVQFKPVRVQDGFLGVKSGDIDVLTHRLTWTISRDIAGLTYTRVMTYDGQGFAVRKDAKIEKIADLDGGVVCTGQGTTSELNATDYFRDHNMKVQLVTFAGQEEAVDALGAGRCDAATNDRMGLAAQMQRLSNRTNFKILDGTISKEPIGPIVSQGQEAWADIVFWTLNALVAAEELGITQANVDDMAANSKNPEVQRLLGKSGEFGRQMGIDNDFALKAIKAVGNYGEMWERHLGPKTPLGLSRGLNDLWTKGGLMLAMPVR
ncbi:MAG: amino acid ABC transporter substrate-binding protein [Xanthobacteraceae bacterium]